MKPFARRRRGAPGEAASYYQLLGVDPAAEGFLIEAAYRALMRRAHPDGGGELARAQLINQAFGVLRDPAARRRYDAALARGEPAPDPTDKRAAPTALEARLRGGARLTTGVYMGLGLVLVIAAAASLGSRLAAGAQHAVPAVQPRANSGAAVIRAFQR